MTSVFLLTIRTATISRPVLLSLLSCLTLNAAVEYAPGPFWKRHTIDDSSRGADGVKTGDINGDGLPDIVTGWEEGGEVRLYLHPGHAKARAPWPCVTVGKVQNAEDAIFADLDGDGRLEVVSLAEGKTRSVLWHRFTGTADQFMQSGQWTTSAFPATAGAQMWMQAAALNVDGQHGADLLLGSKGKDATIGWLQAPAAATDPAGWKYHPLREAGWIMSLAPHDMDVDGDTDIFFTDRKGPRSGVFWLGNPGAEADRAHAAWQEHPIGAQGREVMFADIADVNGDGLQDVIVAVKPAEVLLFLRESDSTWKKQSLQLHADTIGDAKAVKAVELNGDGLTDLVFTCESAKGDREGIVWLEQQKDASWKQRPLGGPGGAKFDLMQLLDLDNDGDLDVLTCEEHDQLGVIWYENPHPAASGDLKAIFDGKTLSGWRALPAGTAGDWVVRDGIIAGTGSQDRQSFLVWKEEDLTDFELDLNYRLPAGGNTGIQIRCQPDPTGKRPLIGYHADIGHAGIGDAVLGAWDFHFAGREEYSCQRGDRLMIDENGKASRTAITDPFVPADVRERDWNHVRVVAKGRNFTFFINGKPASEFMDNAAAGRFDSGGIALQIHDKGMSVEFKDIQLRKLK